MFGSNNNNTSSGVSFGSSNNNNNSATGGLLGAKSGSTGSMFGNGANNNSAGGGLFGNNNTTNKGGLFGNNNNNTASAGLFGNVNHNTASNASSGGIFGNKPTLSLGTSANSNPSTSGGLFANNSNGNSTSGSLFGNKPTLTLGGATSNSASGGLFGNNNNANKNTSSGLFGNNNTINNNTSGGLFGGNSNNNNNTNGGLFGGNSNNNSNTSSGLFGNTNNTTTSTTNNNNKIGGLFGNNGNNQPSFAWTQNNSNGSNMNISNNATLNALQLQKQQQQQREDYSNTIIEQLMKIKASWDPNSPSSLLTTYFYNKVPENEVLLYVKPANVSQEEWNNAIAKRPDTMFVPVKASGFEDLQKRSEAQTNHVAQSRLILKEIESKTKILGDKHDLDSTTRINNCKKKHKLLSKKLLILGCKLSLLKNKGYVLSPEEEVLSVNFEKMVKTLNDPAGLGRLNELWSRLAVLKQRSEMLENQIKNNNTSANNDLINEEIRKVSNILQKQQAGIQYLIEVLEKDNSQLETLTVSKKVPSKK